mgnify:CR=1 FL=1
MYINGHFFFASSGDIISQSTPNALKLSTYYNNNTQFESYNYISYFSNVVWLLFWLFKCAPLHNCFVLILSKFFWCVHCLSLFPFMLPEHLNLHNRLNSRSGVLKEKYYTIQYNSLLTLPRWGFSVTMRLIKIREVVNNSIKRKNAVNRSNINIPIWELII